MTDAHARPTGPAAEPLYDVDVPTPTHAERARTLVTQVPTATLCTVALEPKGHPYGSFVTVAFDDGSPVFLLSALAEHTKNLSQDPRASVLIAEDGSEDPLANGRVTLLGACRQVEEEGREREAFLATHPNAAYYASYGDFGFWKLDVESVRYIGGYGRMSWIERADWQEAEPDPLAASAARVIDHMNADHPDALVDYCRAFSKATDVSSASITGVDRYGFEMSAITPEGPRPIRIAFPREARAPDTVRSTLIKMLEDARTQLGSR